MGLLRPEREGYLAAWRDDRGAMENCPYQSGTRAYSEWWDGYTQYYNEQAIEDAFFEEDEGYAEEDE